MTIIKNNYFLLIILKELTLDDNGLKYIDSLMFPFFTGLIGKENDRMCNCLGQELKEKIKLEIDKEYGSIEEFISVIYNPFNLIYLNEEELRKEKNKINIIYNNEILRRNDLLNQKINNSPDSFIPKKDCKQCNGLGYFKTQKNINGKWTTYKVGGQFNGLIQLNLRHTHNLNESEKHSLFINTTDINYLISKNFIPFAILTHDFKWYEKGLIDEYNFNKFEKTDTLWNNEVFNIYHKYKDCFGVALDCGI